MTGMVGEIQWTGISGVLEHLALLVANVATLVTAIVAMRRAGHARDHADTAAQATGRLHDRLVGNGTIKED